MSVLLFLFLSLIAAADCAHALTHNRMLCRRTRVCDELSQPNNHICICMYVASQPELTFSTSPFCFVGCLVGWPANSYSHSEFRSQKSLASRTPAATTKTITIVTAAAVSPLSSHFIHRRQQ
ncbi:unnamed protein product [Ceratitis capitata]|uniref:(Mediterranean fruit fly) hypothetical protein n=1 Tax=Ceratitis capitata TaxID=7213 RepID=A0A811TZE5_CERCA|nr:unnamed protein product [Ceratitis capitata]